jgi:hypothetical protein
MRGGPQSPASPKAPASLPARSSHLNCRAGRPALRYPMAPLFAEICAREKLSMAWTPAATTVVSPVSCSPASPRNRIKSPSVAPAIVGRAFRPGLPARRRASAQRLAGEAETALSRGADVSTAPSRIQQTTAIRVARIDRVRFGSEELVVAGRIERTYANVRLAYEGRLRRR